MSAAAHPFARHAAQMDITGRPAPWMPTCPLAPTHAQAFDAQGTGLILNDRFINSPPKLSPPLLMFLLDSIKARAESGEAEGVVG